MKLPALFLLACVAACSLSAQTFTGKISTVGGAPPPDQVQALSVSLQTPESLAVDASGNLYVGEVNGSVIRKVNPVTGASSIYAGVGVFLPGASTALNGTVIGRPLPGFSGDDGPARNALLGSIFAEAVDSHDNLFLLDVVNGTVRRVDAATGIISRVAGNGVTPTATGDGDSALAATFTPPRSVAIDTAGNIYIGETGDVRKVSVNTGLITRIAGGGATTPPAGSSIAATTAKINFVAGLAFDSAGNLFISDRTAARVYKLDTNGQISTIAGGGASGDGNLATQAALTSPGSITIDSANNLYICQPTGARIRKIDAQSGIISTFAGNALQGFSGDGGLATSARISNAAAIAHDAANAIYFVDFGNQRVRRIDPVTGIITTVAGNGSPSFNGDNIAATSALFNNPWVVAADADGNIVLADEGDNRIRQISVSDGTITTVAGNGLPGFAGDQGPAASASIFGPQSVAVAGNGDLYIADTNDSRIRKVDHATGTITTVAGTQSSQLSGDGGPATAAGIGFPSDVAIDGNGNYYILDQGNDVIRRVDGATGLISTYAGSTNGGQAISEGALATAVQITPNTIAVDPNGVLYLGDLNTSSVFSVDPATKVVHLVLQNFAGLNSIRFDYAGNLFVGAIPDVSLTNVQTPGEVLRIDAVTGQQTIVAGGGNPADHLGDGGPATESLLVFPYVGLDNVHGNLLISDQGSSRIRSVELLPVARFQNIFSASGAQNLTLAGFSPVQGGTLTFTLVDQPQHGTLSPLVPGNGTAGVTYTPDSSGATTDSFTFKVSDGNRESLPAAVTITTTANGGVLGVGPSSLQFAPAAAGNFGDVHLVTVSNNVTNGSGLILSGALLSNADFTIVSGGSCGSGSITATLAAGASCTIALQYHPQGAGSRTGTLTVSSNAVNGSQSIALSGTATKGASITALFLIAGSTPIAGQGASFTVQVLGTTVKPTGLVKLLEGQQVLSSSQLDASGQATLIAVLGPGLHTLTASYAGDTNFTPSSSVAIPVTPNNPFPFAFSLSPQSAATGSAAFTLTVNGSEFVTGSTVQWNGANRPTTVVSAQKLTASIPASDLASGGIATITVNTPAPGGGKSSSLSFSVDGPAGPAVPSLGSTTITVTAGSSTTVPLTFAGPGKVTNLSVTCLNAPIGTTCSIAPGNGSVTVAIAASVPKGQYSILLVFSTTATASAQLPPVQSAGIRLGGIFGLALALPFGFVALGTKRRRRKLLALGAILVLSVLISAGCGGGASSPPSTLPPAPSTVTSQSSVSATLVVQ
jgi:sugar lactone lactonase YvrE